MSSKSLRQRRVFNKEASKTKKETRKVTKEETEEEEEDEKKFFEETVVASTLFHSAKFEGKEKLRFVRELFNRIARNYDFMNLWI